jgi:hypothetical protein
MAVTSEGLTLTEQQRKAQAAITVRLITQMKLLWPLLDLTDLDRTSPLWLSFVQQLLLDSHAESVAVAREYLRQFRIAEVGTTIAVFDKIRVALDPAATTAMRVTGPVKVKQSMTAGLSLSQAGRLAFSETARTAQLLVLNGGRQMIETGIRRDRRTIGYQRVTDGNPCYFCAMLASRGPVYRKDSFANAKVHIGCGCSLEPVYSRDTNWLKRSEEYAAVYAGVTPGANQTVVAAFRAAYDAQR